MLEEVTEVTQNSGRKRTFLRYVINVEAFSIYIAVKAFHGSYSANTPTYLKPREELENSDLSHCPGIFFPSLAFSFFRFFLFSLWYAGFVQVVSQFSMNK